MFNYLESQNYTAKFAIFIKLNKQMWHKFTIYTIFVK